MKKRDIRLGFRYPIELDVDLYHQRKRLGHFKTRDIGPVGLFIETGPLDCVQQELVHNALHANVIYMANGIVTRHSYNGIGVRFTEVSPSVFQALDKLLSIHDFSTARIRCLNQIKADALTLRSSSRMVKKCQELEQ